MKKHILLTGFLCALMLVCGAYSQTAQPSLSQNVTAERLSNGMQIFINEVPSSAMIHVDFLCRAGYGAQDNANAGFLELYSRLFLSSAKSETVMSYVPVSYKSNADRVTYSCNVTPELFDTYIKAFSKCLTQPSFSEKDIAENYEAMKKKISAYQNTDAGFINSAIEAKVSPESPWKQSFGINSKTFSSYSMEQVKSMLLSVQKNYYTPDNCAIFITGNLSVKAAQTAVQNSFSAWSGSYTGSQYRTQDSATSYRDTQKKFVLTSPDFSTGITQIAVQFTSLSRNEVQLINEIFSAQDSPYKSLITQDASLAVRGKQYLSSSWSSTNAGSRLILQAMMEEPYSIIKVKNAPLLTPADQAELFVKTAKKACDVQENRYEQARNGLYTTFLSQSGANQNLMNLMEDFWTAHPYTAPENLYASLMTDGKDLLAVDKKTVIKDMAEAEPFVFVMINDSEYASCKDSFEKNGYVLITKNDDAWYKDSSYSISNGGEAEKKETSGSNTFSSASYSKYYVDNIRTIASTKLGNGIPVTSKTIKDAQTVLTSISITGGEAESPAKHRKLRSVLVNAGADRINTEITRLKDEGTVTGNVKILSWTTETHSYITVECQKKELHDILTAAVNALINEELDPMTTDLLLREQKYQWRKQSGDLSFQLKNKAMQYLYAGTPFEGVYSISQDSDILMNTTFQTVLLSYSKLLDASLYSIVFTGDIDIKTARKEAEQSFGFLKAQKDRPPTSIPVPKKDSTVLSVQLQHSYNTGMSAASAPKDSPLLVPTKKFYDPMQFYFSAPSSATQREMYNAVLFELANLIKEDLGEGYECRAEAATETILEGSLEAKGLLHKASFIKSYKNARKKLITELESAETSDLRLAVIRNTWSYRTLVKTQTNEGTARLIQSSLLCGPAHLYLESYLFVSNAKGKDFISILNSFFPETPPLQVFSADSQD